VCWLLDPSVQKTSRDRVGWTALPVAWRGGNDQHLVIISACFWNGESMSPAQGLLRHLCSRAAMLRWLTCMRNRRGRLRNQGARLAGVWAEANKWRRGSERSDPRSMYGACWEAGREESTGTDGCRIRFHQFFTSSLPHLESSISRCNTF
jgi:hypothetical protein